MTNWEIKNTGMECVDGKGGELGRESYLIEEGRNEKNGGFRLCFNQLLSIYGI
jgi:hypothetical protein